VRLALASVLPRIPAEHRWEITKALAAHKEDASDRFLPKMIWFGLATVAKSDWKRALDIAKTTPIPELADSIRWAAAQDAAGRDFLAAASAGLSAADAGRIVRLTAFALRDQAS